MWVADPEVDDVELSDDNESDCESDCGNSKMGQATTRMQRLKPMQPQSNTKGQT